MAFGFFRTVWISLRAVNYTTRAFQDTINNLTKTQRAQIRFALNAKRNMMAVGMMYIAFGGIAVQTLGRIIKASRYGERMLMRFGRRAGKSIDKLGETMARMIEPYLALLVKLLEIATAIPLFNKLLSVVLLLGTAFLFVKGTAMVFSGVLGMLKIQHMANILMTKAHQTSLMAYTGQAHMAAGATWSLAGALAAVGGGFAVTYSILMAIGQPIVSLIVLIGSLSAALWALFVAQSAVTGGLFLIPAGAAIGAAVALAQQTKGMEFQMGTSFVKEGGMAMVHAGEEIKSARETRIPSKMERTEIPAYATRRTTISVPITIGTIQTRADKEELRPLILKTIKEAIDNKV